MPNKHAMLSASSSARWLACPPSAQLCAALPDTVTDYAREGTCAHELAEYKVQKLLGNLTSNPTENLKSLGVKPVPVQVRLAAPLKECRFYGILFLFSD